MSNNENKIRLSVPYIILLTVVIALISVAAVFVFKYTNGFTDDFKTFYVEYDGYIFNSRDKVSLKQGAEYRFDVGNSLSFVDKDESSSLNFTVSVVPNVTQNTEFSYTVDGEKFTYSSLAYDDLSAAFGVQVCDGYFTFTTPNNMQTLLSMLPQYSGSTVKIAAGDWDIKPDWDVTPYFSIVVALYSGSSETTIDLYLYGTNEVETPVLSVDKTTVYTDDVITLTWTIDPICSYTTFYGENHGVATGEYRGTTALIRLTEAGEYSFYVRNWYKSNITSTYGASAASNTVTVTVVERDESGDNDDPVEAPTEYPQLAVPKMIIDVSYTSSGNYAYVDISGVVDTNTDTLIWGCTYNGIQLSEQTIYLGDGTRGDTLTVPKSRAGVWTFYGIARDSTGKYLDSERSETVTVTIDFDNPAYVIKYDVLGNGGVASVDFDCPDTAAQGATVTFTLTLLDDSVEITNVVIQDGETGEDLEIPIARNGDSYTFTMPQCSVTVLIYLMTK